MNTREPPSAAEVADLVRRYTENLMRAAYSLGFPDSEVEELVQATFVAYLDGGSRFQKRSQLLTYLFGILYNKARETKRLRERYYSIDASVDDEFESHFDADGHWNEEAMAQMSEVEKQAQSSNLRELLQQCLGGLSPAMRLAFTLKEVEGLDSSSICTSLNLTTTHLGVTLFRARNKLRECLISKGAVIV